jgi:hypothetical protein
MLLLLVPEAHGPHTTRGGASLPVHGCSQIVGICSVVLQAPCAALHPRAFMHDSTAAALMGSSLHIFPFFFLPFF